MDCDDIRNIPWDPLPDLILLNIFKDLNYRELLKVGQVNQLWYRISHDEMLWRRLFHRDFKIPSSVPLAAGKKSWFAEYKRLIYQTPTICSEVLLEHDHQVLHVSFSHDGSMFATCSKDGYVIVWDSGHPCSVKYSYDMKVFSWKYTQFSQFNQSDTLLLVSGVHFGSPHSTSGEIAVFSLEGDFKLQCRVGNKPYDIFGTWFSNRHLLSGDVHWLAHLVSMTGLWINRASQEVYSEHAPLLNQLFKFYNPNASSVRTVMVAECDGLPADESTSTPGNTKGAVSNSAEGFKSSVHCMEPKAKVQSNLFVNNSESDVEDETEEWNEKYLIYQKGENSHGNEGVTDEMADDCSEDEDLANLPEKLLIFTTGSKTYTPHQIGFKRIKTVNFPKVIERGPSIQERLAEKERRERQPSVQQEPDWLDYKSVEHRFDKIDHIIDLHGHIIGMGLSPDHRYLYVNSRPWPEGYKIRNPLDPPPIAQEIDIHVIDLTSFQEVGTLLRAHKAYTPNNECFFIFLDVCQDYVSSGAEDKHGYLWDRHYGVCIAKLPHSDVVNSVAFNPQDEGMLVTTSDDFTIKVWRSKSFFHSQSAAYQQSIKESTKTASSKKSVKGK